MESIRPIHLFICHTFLFTHSRLVAEFPATGGVVPSWKFQTVKLIRYTDVTDYVVLACECIFVVYLIYYIIEEGIEASVPN